VKTGPAFDSGTPTPFPQFQRPSPAREGTVMLEFVVSFPIILTLILACMQFAHIWMARQVVHYSAFCAARATLVCNRGERTEAARQAARQVCAWIVNGMRAGEPDKRIPGWGTIPGSGGVDRKTQVTVEDAGPWNVKVTVKHDFALIMPIVGPMIGWAVSPWEIGQGGTIYTERRVDDSGNIGNSDLIRYPHIRFTEVVFMSKPYVTVPMMGIPSGGW
jgi:Flp pilus assembly protein TadG